MIDFRPIVVVEGIFILVIGFLMMVPGAVDWVASDPEWKAFVISAGISIVTGVLMVSSSWTGDISFNIRQGFLLTTTSWILISAVSAIPFVLAGLKIDYTDAFFEAMSGLTTTGSTVLSGLDNMPSGILLWRSLLQWIGGIGIIVTAVAMLPFLRVGGMQLFRMESSDKSEKILPRAGQIAGVIGLVYFGLTVLGAIAYALAGMTDFEAINHAMTTLSTGGFSTSDQSMGHFKAPAIHWVSTAFMLLGGLPFALYVKALHGKWKDLFQNSQVQSFIYFLLLVILSLSAWLSITQGVPVLKALRLTAFNVVSVVTTTGYASTDYSLWGTFPIVVFFFLTFVGGCTGSTAGGIKIFRFEIMYKIIRQQLHSMLYPRGVFIVQYNSRNLPNEVMRSIGIFVSQFCAIVVLMTFLLSMTGLDLMTSITGAVTAIANVGPGLGKIIGPSGNFSSLPDTAKWILSIGMLVGRLEIMTVLVLLTRGFWKA